MDVRPLWLMPYKSVHTKLTMQFDGAESSKTMKGAFLIWIKDPDAIRETVRSQKSDACG